MLTPLPDLIHQGISEKVALVTQYTSSFVTGYVSKYATSVFMRFLPHAYYHKSDTLNRGVWLLR